MKSVQPQAPVLLPVFADQLSHRLASLAGTDREDAIVLMMEVAAEAQTVPHHARKLVFLFSAMRHFVAELQQAGWRVRYVRLDDPGNSGDFSGEMRRALEETGARSIRLTWPGEYRVLEMARSWQEQLGVPVEILDDDRFLASLDEFRDWAAGRKQLRMEYFYRAMRRKTGLLMAGSEPEGGRWNFDQENRKPARRDMFMPSPLAFNPDAITGQVIAMVRERFPDRFGEIDPFDLAVTAADAVHQAQHFMREALPGFGDHQDAMLSGEPFLHHSVLSHLLNAGLLDPLELCRMAESEYRAGRAPLNAVEGYVRQIIGWREYVRGIYWLHMPGYASLNHLDAAAPLPEFYWTGETRMNCMRSVIGDTIRHAYSHHIQRLMVTGNFALLAGIDPRQVHEWYLAVYADAFEWVEMPNTIGMALFADGGIMASKPYAASGAYINRMSDFCKGCRYDPGVRTGEDACPFNPLYWDFLERNRKKLAANSRMAMMLRNLDVLSQDERACIGQSARAVRAKMVSGSL